MPFDLTIPQADRDRLLIFNLRTDSDDHILGFTTRWINEVALYYTHVDVLTTHKGRLTVADNVTVYSTGREQGLNRPQQLIQFYSTLSRLLLKHDYSACFAHMQPMFAVLAAPLLRLRGVKVTTWYTHRQINRMVQIASRWSYRIVSAVESSFPVQTTKLRPLGHGIDTAFYSPSHQPKHDPPRIVQVARLTEIKHQHILLDATRDIACEVVFVGDIPDGYADDYKTYLKQRVETMGMTDKVIFAGAQTPQQVVDWYNSATVAVNLSPRGLFDKAALESMACAVPTVVSNPAFDLLTTRYQSQLQIKAPDDVVGLNDCLKQLLTTSESDRQQMGIHLRNGVVVDHSLATLVKKLITVMHTGDLPLA